MEQNQSERQSEGILGPLGVLVAKQAAKDDFRFDPSELTPELMKVRNVLSIIVGSIINRIIFCDIPLEGQTQTPYWNGTGIVGGPRETSIERDNTPWKGRRASRVPLHNMRFRTQS